MKDDLLLRFKSKQKYIVFDTETEGLNLISSRPWQASWIIAEGKNIISKHDRYIDIPNLKISEEAKRITGFDINYYDSHKEDPKVVLADLSKYLYNPEYIVVGQNLLGFDVYMVNVLRKMVGLPSDYSYINRIIDTKSLAAAIFKQILPDKENFLAWQYKMLHITEKRMKTSQITLLKHYNIPFNEDLLHNSLYDVEMCFQVFLKQIYDIDV